MSKYFRYFPTTDHDLTNIGQSVKLTNVLRRFKFKSILTQRVDTFYNYTVQSGDRPDTIAEKYYGSPNDAWIVLHFNDIMDPLFDFPLSDNALDDMVKKKYGSIAAAQAEVHEYRHIIQQAQTLYDGTHIPKKYVVVDQTTYNTLDPLDREDVDKYEYEIEVNDEKREIKILDKKYLSILRDEVEDILRNGV
jgi:hypothetical protein